MNSKFVLATALMVAASPAGAGDRGIVMTASPDPISPGQL